MRKMDSFKQLQLSISQLIKVTLPISLLIVFSLHTSAQWNWLNPKPSGYTNNNIVFADHKTGYILNSKGDLYKTTNTGGSWNNIGNFPGSFCMDIKYSTGVIAGAQGIIYVSSDNGNSWQQINTGIQDILEKVSIVSRDTFFVSIGYKYSSNYGAIYQTTDRGKSWVNLNCNVPIHSIMFLNSQIGYVGSAGGYIAKTEDGGRTWQQKKEVTFIPSSIEAMQFLNKDTGYAFQEYDSLLTTYDGGNTWRSADAYETMDAISFVNSTDGYLGGEDGALYATHDGGKTFEWAGFDGLREGNQINSIYFLSRDTGFAVGEHGRIMKTTNAGKNWSAYNTPTYLPITSVAYGTASTAYATDWNNMYKTLSGGATWDTVNLTTGAEYPSSSRFEKAYFINADTGFVTSSFPVRLHHTFNGGATWDTIDPGPPIVYASWDNVSDLQFLNNKTGFMTITQSSSGFQGTIVKTEDGGISWQNIYTAPIGQGFTHIYYVSEDTGYATDYLNVYKTTDGSKTWSLMYNSYDDYSLTSIAFTSPQNGFVVNYNNDIIETNDGGKTWKTLRLSDFGDFTGEISGMKFYNRQIGYITTFDKIFETIDSGATWQIINTISPANITFSSDSSVVFYGIGGSVLSSNVRNVYNDSISIAGSCPNILSAVITSVLSRTDSISFEINDATGATISIPASPSFADNKRVHCIATTSSLIPHRNYMLRVKYLYDGKYSYSVPKSFTIEGILAPAITKSGNTLSSTYASGNQWFRNDTLIEGATQQIYALPVNIPYNQCYAVSETNSDGCLAKSDTICIDTTGTTLVMATSPSPIIIYGQYNSGGVLINWQTNSETNTSSFVIERSNDNVDFSKTGMLNAHGTFSNPIAYYFTDTVTRQPITLKLYYRVKTIFKDGSFAYSDTITVLIPEKDGKFTIAPNPARNMAVIYFSNPVLYADILIVDKFGRTIYSGNYNGVAQSTYQLNTSKLNNGIYSVIVVTATNKFTYELIIIK